MQTSDPSSPLTPPSPSPSSSSPSSSSSSPSPSLPFLLEPVRTPEQIKKTAELAEIIWTEHYTPLIGAAQVAYMIEKFQSVSAVTAQIRQGYRYYLMQSGGISAGYTAVLSEPVEKSLFLSKIYVEKSYRGRHFTSKTLAALKKICREEDLEKIRLTVNKGNHSSLAVYEHLGFVQVQDIVTDIGEGYVMDDYIMEMTI
ncbi:MAG: GNAT family N-acetyltransferase [Methanocorpusculum sp.]|uniref:GNAT family N-acetyltransferase n=1 Tax=Methanocorpusculum sp. TaxID=2058474 RepID=UPI002B212DAC|nr:GNAT family N-acetyltransferase [Methanocorpusculum sp.]MEA5087126.1 GNAT family N-acetyltransferase [Methanocorpusculum sp.]